MNAEQRRRAQEEIFGSCNGDGAWSPWELRGDIVANNASSQQGVGSSIAMPPGMSVHGRCRFDFVVD